VRIFVDTRVMVVDIAILGTGPDLSTADPERSDRVLVFHRPGADIEVVHVLLDIEVARQPGEGVPVAHLPLHVAPAGLARLHPDRAAEVPRFQRPDLPERAVVYPLHCLPACSGATSRKSRED